MSIAVSAKAPTCVRVVLRFHLGVRTLWVGDTCTQPPSPDGSKRQLSRQIGHLGHDGQNAQQGFTVGAESHSQGSTGDVEKLDCWMFDGERVPVTLQIGGLGCNIRTQGRWPTGEQVTSSQDLLGGVFLHQHDGASAH